VPLAEAEAYAQNISARHIRVSARTGQGVDEGFKNLVEEIVKVKENVTRHCSQPNTSFVLAAGMVCDDDASRNQKKSKCCH